MEQKIALYEEVLTLEPGSRLFFPLAEMYLKSNLLEKAEETLCRGLAVHPDFFEAKLLLLDVLSRQGRVDEMTRVAAPLVEALQGCAALWTAWSSLAGTKGGEEGLLMRMIGHVLSGNRFSWAEIMAAGLDGVAGCGQTSCQNKPVSGKEVPDVTELLSDSPDRLSGEDDPDAEEVDLAELEDDVKTRTLADLLAYQEEYEQAMLIYEQLRDTASTVSDRQLFQARVDAMRVKLDSQQDSSSTTLKKDLPPSPSAETDPEPQSGSDPVIDTLAALAERLEQRGSGENETKNTN